MLYGRSMLGGSMWPIVLIVGALALGAIASAGAYALSLAEGAGSAEAEYKNLARANQETLDALEVTERARAAGRKTQTSTEAELAQVRNDVEEFQRRESERLKEKGCNCDLGDVKWPWEVEKSKQSLWPWE